MLSFSTYVVMGALGLTGQEPGLERYAFSKASCPLLWNEFCRRVGILLFKMLAPAAGVCILLSEILAEVKLDTVTQT
jgi:hypothetical protein